MPTRGSGAIGYNEVQSNMGGSNPIGNNEYRGRDGSWAWGTMANSDSYYCRPRPYFEPRPGPERIQYWFRSGSNNVYRFNPTVSARGSGTIVYYATWKNSYYPSQFDGLWRQTNQIFVPRGTGENSVYIQAHNGISGYRVTLGYRWRVFT